ncbi:hypothetical protein EDD86DRAFT_92152 [Gorgonomyces haynaldii]|nr:hypothetical protein EDD86DRAFT_92152 [Gorgonomyces haynaldii]
MRLLTHNLLQCHVKGCNSNNFPLRLSKVQLQTLDIEVPAEFVRNMLHKLDYPALYKTCESIGIQIPQELPEEVDDLFLESLGNVILKTKISEGQMECPNCQRVYVVKDGIPNMLLLETEV